MNEILVLHSGVSQSMSTTLEVGREVREISDEMEEKTLAKRRKRWLRLQVTTSPLKQANLRLPTTYPFERRAQAWPPFLGVRKELGESA